MRSRKLLEYFELSLRKRTELPKIESRLLSMLGYMFHPSKRLDSQAGTQGVFFLLCHCLNDSTIAPGVLQGTLWDRLELSPRDLAESKKILLSKSLLLR